MRILNRYTIPLILTVVVLAASNLNWNTRYYKNIILSDGKGYYAYLPAVFIYHDLHFNFADSIEEQYYNRNTIYEYRTEVNNVCMDRYFAGTAVAMAPFFFIAQGLSYWRGNLMDGYSFFYPVLINIAAIFYLFLFLLYLKKLLRLYGVSETNQSITLVSMVFGTNVFYYTNIEPSMSHVYSLAFITMFLYQVRTYLIRPANRQILYAALSLGMIMLIRPQNLLICLAIPFLADRGSQLKNSLKAAFTHKKTAFIGLAAALLIVSVQLILYKLETGQFWVYSYPGERFYWLEPEFINILFSYYRGFFIYTPLAFIALAGLYFLWKQNRFRAWSFLLFFAFLTYFLSSWWSWNYGGCFGLRAYVEFYALFALLLATALENLRGMYRSVYIVLIFLCVVVCQVQTYQYRYDQVYWANMTKERYWDVFMKIGKRGVH